MKLTVAALLPLFVVLFGCQSSETYVIVVEESLVQKLSKPGDTATLALKDPIAMPSRRHNVMIQHGEYLIYPIKDFDTGQQSYYVPIISEFGEVVSSEPPGMPGSIYVRRVWTHNSEVGITLARR